MAGGSIYLYCDLKLINLENKILIEDKESMIRDLELNEFIILDSQTTFITDIIAKKLYIRGSSFIAITDSKIDEVILINSQNCLISHNSIKSIKIDNKLRQFKVWFSKRRNRKFGELYGSNGNTICANLIEDNTNNNNIMVI